MAEDTQNLASAKQGEQPDNDLQNSSSRRPKYEPAKSQTDKLWDAFGKPEDQVNTLPGKVSSNTIKEGKDTNDVTVTDALKSLSSKDLTTFYKLPCARNALMLGIGAAFGVGGIRGVLGGLRSMWTACNWAVGSFAVTSIASHEFCQRRRIQEMDGMKQAAELMTQLKMKKQREKDEAARLVEEEKRRKSWTNLSNYKFW